MNQWEERPTVTNALGETLPIGASWERRQPARPGELLGDLVLPLGQAIVTGIVGGLAGALLGGRIGAAIGGVGSFGITWIVLLAQTRAGLWTVERIIGQDLDGDGFIGEAEEQPVVRIEISEHNHNGGRMSFCDLPITEEKLQKVAQAVIDDDTPFSRRGLENILSQPEYERLAKAMMDAGLLRSMPGNKRELSGPGRALFRKVKWDK